MLKFAISSEAGITTLICLLFLLQESLGEEVLRMSTDEIVSRTRLLDNEIKVGEIQLCILVS